jgi:hypothetical protein
MASPPTSCLAEHIEHLGSTLGGECPVAHNGGALRLRARATPCFVSPEATTARDDINAQPAGKCQSSLPSSFVDGSTSTNAPD